MQNNDKFQEEFEEDDDSKSNNNTLAPSSSNSSLPTSTAKPTNAPTPPPPSPSVTAPPLPNAKKAKMSFGFNKAAATGSRPLAGNAFATAARTAKPPAPKKEVAKPAAKPTGIEALKQELEVSSRHRPSHSSSSSSSRSSHRSSSSSAPKSPDSRGSKDDHHSSSTKRPSDDSKSSESSKSPPKSPSKPTEEPKQAAVKKTKLKHDFQEDSEMVDDFLRGVLPSHLRKGLQKAPVDNGGSDDELPDKKDEITKKSIFGSDSEDEDEVEAEQGEITESGEYRDAKIDKDEPLMPAMERFMKQIYVRDSAKSRTLYEPGGVVDVKGDIFKSDCDVFIHCCNCMHTMSAGIARKIKKVFPEAYQKDMETPYSKIEKLGHFTSVLTPAGITVVNLYAQYGYGSQKQHLNYDALEIGLTRLMNLFKAQNIYPKIGTYYMGCFNGGGDINEVKKIFARVFTEFPVYVYNQDRS